LRTPPKRYRRRDRVLRAGVFAWVVALALLVALPALLDRPPSDGSESAEALRFSPYRTVAALESRETPYRTRVPRQGGG